VDRRRLVPAMDLVKVDVVEAEALERRIDRSEDVLARQAAPVLAPHGPTVDLRRDDVLLAHAEELAEHPAGDDLALTAVVDVGRVEEDDPALDGPAHDGVRRHLVKRPWPRLVPAKAHHPDGDAGDAQPRPADVHR